MIETQQLIIRKFTQRDLPEFKRLLEIKEVPGWGMQRARAGEFLNWYISNYDKMDIVSNVICFGIFHRDTREVLGAAGAGKHDDLNETEIFFNMLKHARGQGYATLAARAVTRWALENYDIPYIIGTAGINNTASQRVLEKCGYQYMDTRTLKVHLMDESYSFKYYRHYKNIG